MRDALDWEGRDSEDGGESMIARNSPDGGVPDAIEVFEYPAMGAPPLAWDGFPWDVLDDAAVGGSTDPRDLAGETAAESAPTAEDLERSFETGRARGVDEGRAAERQALAELARREQERRIEEAARLADQFRIERARYFQAVEREVVELALAVAARILRREVQMDPLLLSGVVRAALGQLSSSTEVRLRVPAADLELWNDTVAHLPNLPVKPVVAAGQDMAPGECRVETEIGTVDLGIRSQLKSIGREFFDGGAAGRDAEPLASVSEDMSE